MDYRDYVARLGGWARLGELTRYGVVRERERDYPLFKLTVPGERWLTVTSGFHGDEQAGPLTLLEHMAEVVDAARAAGVGLRVYPCINPSGFEARTRYNLSGERPNNDLMRYEIAPGVFRGELRDGEAFLRWELFRGGPKETQALRAELERDPPPHAALDIHQDGALPGRFCYAYTFGERAGFRPLLETSAQWVEVAVERTVDESAKIATGPDGLIEYHDGSVTDYFRRLGVPWCAALETTLQTPLELCHQVNLAWIRGFLEFAAQDEEAAVAG